MSVPYPPNAYQTNPYQPQPKVRFQWISEAWQLFLTNVGTWIGAVVVVGAISYAVSLAGMFLFGIRSALMSQATSGVAPSSFALFEIPGYWALLAISSLVSAFFAAGLLRMANAQVRRQPVEISTLFSGTNAKLFLPIFGFQILYGIFSGIGFVLLFLPGFIVVGLLTPALPLIADGVPLGQAMERSLNAMKSDWLMAGVFAFVFILLFAVGTAVTCGLGSLALYPMGLIVLSLIYRDMIGMPLPSVPDPLQAGYGAAQPGVWPPSPGTAAPAPYSPQPTEATSPPWSSQQPLGGAPQQQPQPGAFGESEASRQEDGDTLPPTSAP